MTINLLSQYPMRTLPVRAHTVSTARMRRAATAVAFLLLMLSGLGSHSACATPVGRLLLSEVLFNPTADGCDYVELYNPSDTACSTAPLRFARITAAGTIGRLYSLGVPRSVPPHDYLVLTTDAAWLLSHFPKADASKVIEVDALPAWPNERGCVALVAAADSLMVDRLDYTSDMHHWALRNAKGIALERRSFTTATAERSNWASASAASGGGSPTLPNSQQRQALELFALQPSDLFSPDGDGHNDELHILPPDLVATAGTNITVFDLSGRRVRQLCRNARLGSNEPAVWDGHSEQGTLCPSGDYVLLIEVYDPYGHTHRERKAVHLITH